MADWLEADARTIQAAEDMLEARTIITKRE